RTGATAVHQKSLYPQRATWLSVVDRGSGQPNRLAAEHVPQAGCLADVHQQQVARRVAGVIPQFEVGAALTIHREAEAEPARTAAGGQEAFPERLGRGRAND